MAKTTTGDQWILDSYGGYCRWCGRRRTFPFANLTQAQALPCENPTCPSNLRITVRLPMRQAPLSWEGEITDD